MASIITAGTSTGTALNMTGDTSGVLALATNNGTTAVTITTAQNVGIGTASPYSVSNYTGLTINGTNGGTLSLFTNGTRSFTAYSTSGAVVMGSVTSIPLVLNTGDTERMRIDSSGNVGIGNTSPSYKLDVTGVIRNSSGPDALPATQQRITVYNDASNWAYFAYGVDALMRITYSTTSTSAPLLFGTSSAYDNTGTFTETMRISATSALVLKGGTANPGGVGITFPASQSASSNANTLDDYEEGTWTPNISSNNGTGTFVTKGGSYVKIGKQVTCWFAVDGGSSLAAGTTQYVVGIPFPIGSLSENTIMGQLGVNAASSLTLDLMTLSGNRNVAFIYSGGGQYLSTITFGAGSFTYWVD